MVGFQHDGLKRTVDFQMHNLTVADPAVGGTRTVCQMKAYSHKDMSVLNMKQKKLVRDAKNRKCVHT
jgi:hypothetical protein